MRIGERRGFRIGLSWSFTLLLFCGGVALAKEIRVAVSSNFAEGAKIIAQRFQERSGHRVHLVFGSTGKLYAQIRNGAPFDLFLAADTRRPALLEQEGIALSGSRVSYALGRLVLWSPKADYVDSQAGVLNRRDFHHLAIANPKLAPYGRAAMQVLRHRGLWSSLRDRIAQGENIGQTFQFVLSGNAELGFVAASQIRSVGSGGGGSAWFVPQELYDPIVQQGVLLTSSPAARAFLDFITGDVGRGIIVGLGYRVP